MSTRLSIYKYVKVGGKWRYCRAALLRNGKIKPNIVVVGGREEKHAEGQYYALDRGKWVSLGENASSAQHKRSVMANNLEHEKLTGGGSESHAGRKILKDEIEAYLADLMLAKVTQESVMKKRRYLMAFLECSGKEYADQVKRSDVLKFRNGMLKEYDPCTVDKQMMAVVTLFKRWLKMPLGMESGDWPEFGTEPPDPFSDEEMAALERTTGDINLLIRLFRSTGCRDMEIAHLDDADIDARTKQIHIRPKPCSKCKNCISRGNIWKPKTKASTRSIPISDSLVAELLARPRGLLFPNKDGRVDAHFLRKVQRAAKSSGVQRVKLHRLRDTFITNKLRDGIDIRTVQRWAGHDDINQTMEYAAWLDAQSEAARNSANREDTRYRTGTHGD